MHKRKLLLSLFFLYFSGYHTYAQTMMDIFVPEIIELNSAESKESFLLNIYELDQKVRNDKTNCENIKFGSLECAEYALIASKADLENLTKITAYLRLYGYPNKENFSDKACNAPWLVLHHNVGKANQIDKEFAPILVHAYRNNNISLVNLHWYLKRYYLNYMGMSYKRTETSSEEEDIEDLIKVLKIQ